MAVREGGHPERLPAVAPSRSSPATEADPPCTAFAGSKSGRETIRYSHLVTARSWQLPRARSPLARQWQRSASTPRSYHEDRGGRTGGSAERRDLAGPVGHAHTDIVGALCRLHHRERSLAGGAVRCRRRRARAPRRRPARRSTRASNGRAPARRGRRDREGTPTSRDGRSLAACGSPGKLRRHRLQLTARLDQLDGGRGHMFGHDAPCESRRGVGPLSGDNRFGRPAQTGRPYEVVRPPYPGSDEIVPRSRVGARATVEREAGARRTPPTIERRHSGSSRRHAGPDRMAGAAPPLRALGAVRVAAHRGLGGAWRRRHPLRVR